MRDSKELWLCSSMQFEYDPERLIEEVKKRPGIWDYEDADYRTKANRCKLWTEVVKELMQTDVTVTKSEIRELEIQLQKKWKSIRDCFQKYVVNPNRSRRPYIYSKQLQFILKEQQPTRKEEPGHSSDSEEPQNQVKGKKRSWLKKQVLKVGKDEEESSEDDNSDTLDNADSRDYSNEDSQPHKIAKISIPQSQVEEFAFANVDAHVKLDSEDPDKLFLLSLLPHLKSIPDHFRLNAKMELLQVLRNANYSTGDFKTFTVS